MNQDYYKVLGVDRSADAATIKKAYRKMAMKYHPDQNPGDKEAEDKFKQAAEAYDVLSNPNKKSQYDRFGSVGGPGGGFGGGGFADVGDIFDSFGDIFGDIFGGGGSRRRRQGRGPRSGADLRYHLEIELKDVLNGAEKEIEFDFEKDCSPCSGSGAEPGSKAETCNTCGGQGQVIQRQGFFQVQTTCPTCRGEGTQIKEPCKACSGRGRESSHKKLSVTIPAGIETGNQLRLTREGEGGYLGGPSGDLYVEVRVKEHPDFKRQGQDLYSVLEVSYLQALLGVELKVETLEGEAELKVPRGTAPGEQLKLQEMGLPHLRRSRRGDHYYQVEVVIPKKLAKKEEALLREIADLTGEDVAAKKGLFG